MASVIQVGGKWRAQVRRKGYPPRTQTFLTKALADKWGRQVESEIDAGRAGQLAPAHITVGSLIERYEDEVGKTKPFGKNKAAVLKLLKNRKDGLGAVSMAELTPERLVKYITEQRRVSGVTASIDLTYLKGVLRIAGALWKVGVPRGVVEDAREILKHMGLVNRSNERDRRPTADELKALKTWFAHRSETLTPDHIEFILDSCFRPPSEITRLRWADLNHEDKTIVIRDRKDPRKKIGNHQTVPLLGKCYEIIMRQPQEDGQEFIFAVNGKTWSSLFPRACEELGIEDLQLYDLRHEAISRLVESRKYSIHEMMLVTGHKDPKQLTRYTQLKAKDLHDR